MEPLDTIIKKLWAERQHLVQHQGATQDDKKNRIERLKIVTDDLHDFMKLYAETILDKNEQKIDVATLEKKVAKETRLQHESDVGFVDSDHVAFEAMMDRELGL